jgi:hypothetical protein
MRFPKIYTMALVLFFQLSYISLASANELEYTIDSAGRTYSPGLSVSPAVAYKIGLWGEETSPLAGSLRPKITTVISPATYGARAELEFSPVTFVNLSAGKNFLRRFSHFDDDSCLNNNCVGSLNSIDLSARFLFKVSSVIGSLKYTKSFFDEKDDKSQNLVDPNTYLLISPNKEIADQLEGILGVELNDTWSTGVLVQHVELKKNHGIQNGQYLLALMKNGNSTYIAGAGRFESDLKPSKPSLILTFKYEWK